MAEKGMLTEQTPTQTFTFFKGAEEGEGNPNYLYEQRGLNEKATVEDLKAYFNAKKSNRLRESFGTFDNYLAYMTEREQLIQSGDYDVGNWAEADAGFTEDQQMIFEGDADLTIDPSDPGQNLQNLRKRQMGAQSGAYENWANSEANQALLQKYGINDTVYSDSGDKFRWNGSAYVKTQDEDKISMGDYAKMAMGVAVGSFAGPALGKALTGATGAATGAATGTTAAATTTGSFVQGAVNNLVGSALSQGIATGSIDARQLAAAGITGGIGGVADAIKAGDLAGTAASNAISDLATTTGLSVAETTDIVSGVLTGAVTGSDLEDIALGAVQGYTTGQVQNLVEDTLGPWIEIPNLFDEDSTFISTEDLSPFINTAVNAVFEGELTEGDVLKSIYDYVEEGGTLTFLDPTRGLGEGSLIPDIDLDIFGNVQIPEGVREFGREAEDVVRAIGSETEDIVRDVVRPIGEVGTAIGQPVGDVLSAAETAVRRALPDISLPDGPDINLPSVPSFTGGGLLTGVGGGQEFKKVDPGGITYDPRTQLAMIQPNKQQPTALDQITQYLNTRGLFS